MNKKIKKILILSLFIAGSFFSYNYAKADIVAPKLSHFGCRNYVMQNISHNQSFKTNDSINFSFSIECPKDMVSYMSTTGSGASYPTKCSASFGLGNDVSGNRKYDAKTKSFIRFDYILGSKGSHTNGLWTLTDMGDGYVRCSGSATYQFPSLSTKYQYALIYPIFTDYPDRSNGGTNLGTFGEHINITDVCVPTTWSPPASETCEGVLVTQTDGCQSRSVYGTKDCSLPGICGISNGKTLTSKPTTGLCTQVTASTVSGSGPWTWSCYGSGGGTTASCSADKAGVGVDGQCGSANGQTFTSTPTNNLCSAGIVTAVTGNGPWSWSCKGSENAYFKFSDGQDEFMIKLTDSEKIKEARDILAGVETGKVHIMGGILKEPVDYNNSWSYHLYPPSIMFFESAIEVCDAGIKYVEDHLNDVCGAFLPKCVWCPWSSELIEEVDCHTFGGDCGGTTASCSADKAGVGVNECGSDNGQTLTTPPPSSPTGLCVIPGTATAVTGLGPWNWNCLDSEGEIADSCSADKAGEGPSTSYSCTGSIANSTLCVSDDSGLTVDTVKTLVDTCSVPTGSAPKCEVTCKSDYKKVYYVNTDSHQCDLIPSSPEPEIIGGSFQIPNIRTGDSPGPVATWSAENSVRCNINSDNNGNYPNVCDSISSCGSGSATLNPVTLETIYTLICYNQDGTEVSELLPKPAYLIMTADPTEVEVDFAGGGATTEPDVELSIVSWNGLKESGIDFTADLSELPESPGDETTNTAFFDPETLSLSSYYHGIKSILRIFASYRFTDERIVNISGSGTVAPVEITVFSKKTTSIYEPY